MASASSTTSSNWRYNVFPSFRGEDVRSTFLSHLLMELERKLITTFNDNGIDRSRPIGPELLLAIKESRIAIVIFSRNYASSTWCLNELVEIHKCFQDLDQMVIPIFYHVDPSEVRKQTGEFGWMFKETCKDKKEDDRERWIQALTDVANLAGEDSKNWESTEIVRMHSLLQKLGKEIDLAEPINKRRFLMEAEEIREVLTNITGTKNTLAMYLNMSDISGPLFIDENSFQGMSNLKLLNFTKSWWPRETGKGRLYLPDGGLRHFPRKLRLLRWDDYPSKSMPFNFRMECLVGLKMENSKLEKLWEGTQFLGSLKEMDMSYSADLKEIPDLSEAINAIKLNLCGCSSLVALPSSIRNLNKLYQLILKECSSLTALPSSIGNLSELYELDLKECSSLVTLPSSIGNLSKLCEMDLRGCSSLVTLPYSIGNLSKLYKLDFWSW